MKKLIYIIIALLIASTDFLYAQYPAKPVIGSPGPSYYIDYVKVSVPFHISGQPFSSDDHNWSLSKSEIVLTVETGNAYGPRRDYMFKVLKKIERKTKVLENGSWHFNNIQIDTEGANYLRVSVKHIMEGKITYGDDYMYGINQEKETENIPSKSELITQGEKLRNPVKYKTVRKMKTVKTPVVPKGAEKKIIKK